LLKVESQKDEYSKSCVFHFLKSQVVLKQLACPHGKSLIVVGRSFSFETQICPGPITANVCVYAVWGIGGLKNGAQRNVKPDLLRTVPRDQTTF
jgi:hypothetical protein